MSSPCCSDLFYALHYIAAIISRCNGDLTEVMVTLVMDITISFTL